MAATDDDAACDRLLDSVGAVRPIGPPESDFIAALVEHAQNHGIFQTLLDDRAGGPSAIFVAAAYLAAHRAGHGEDAVELHKVPEPVTSDHAESLDAAACDPHAAGLYLAAAAHLNAWWQDPGDPSDPRPDLAAPAPA